MKLDALEGVDEYLSGNMSYQNLIENLPAAIYTCDNKGYILHYNKAAVELWGREPAIGKDQWCGSWKIFNPDGSPLPLEECPMAIAIREGKIVSGREIIVERADGKRLNVLPHPQPIRNASGVVIGAVNMLVDITAQKSIEQKLRESEDRLRLATEGSQLATWDLDVKTQRLIYSPYLTKIFGRPDSAMFTQQDIRSQIHPDDMPMVNKEVESALKNGPLSYEARIIHPDKSIHWIRTQGKIIFDVNKIPVRMLGTVMDISDRKEKESHIENLAAIVESSDDAIVSVTMNGTITSWNDGARNLYGYSLEEMIGRTMSVVIPLDRHDEEDQILTRIRNGENVDHYETVRIRKDKELIDLSLTVSPIKDPEGNIIGASKSARNITKQKQAERTMLENEQRLQIVVAASELGTWELNVKTSEVYYSKRYLEIFGFPDKTVLEHADLLKRLHPEDRQKRDKALEEAYVKGSLDYTSRLVWTDGSIHWIEAKGKVFYDGHNKPLKLIGTVRDVTKEKLFTDELEDRVRQRTMELHQRNEDLVRSNIELGQFAYVASHDLQEPLRKILTFSQRILELDEDKLSDRSKDYFNRVRSASSRMKQLIIDLLTYSRANTTERNFEITNLTIVLNTVLDQLKETIDQKQAVIKSTQLPTAPVIRYQFEQLLTNIISNALKFAKQNVTPIINISADKVKGSEINSSAIQDADYHRIAIRDNGIGFDQQFSGRIFEVFQRLHSKEEYAGTGIGLSIVKKIVENHNGFITTESELGKGATFKIFIPVE